MTRSLWILTSLSSGKLASRRSESNTMPKNGREVVGPSTFSRASGTPNLYSYDKDVLRLPGCDCRCLIEGGPRVRKSSR